MSLSSEKSYKKSAIERGASVVGGFILGGPGGMVVGFLGKEAVFKTLALQFVGGMVLAMLSISNPLALIATALGIGLSVGVREVLMAEKKLKKKVAEELSVQLANLPASHEIFSKLENSADKILEEISERVVKEVKTEFDGRYKDIEKRQERLERSTDEKKMRVRDLNDYDKQRKGLIRELEDVIDEAKEVLHIR